MSANFMRMLQNMAPRTNRTLEDLRNADGELSGMDGMELRGWAYQSPTVPSRDLTDPLGKALLAVFKDGQFNAVQKYVEARTAELGGDGAAVRNELYDARWGPTRTTIYNVLLPALHAMPAKKHELLGVTRYLVNDVKVPVDGKDVMGCTSLYWAISTKPYVQPEFAQILFDAGGSLNSKNRFNSTVASEIAQADVNGDTAKSVDMMKFYMEHGGDVEGRDTDGMTVKMLVEMMREKVPGMAEVIGRGRGPRAEGDCTTCGRSPTGENKVSACGKCKTARYCSQECQRVDWKAHKRTCTAV
ncbi:zf-MYND-domain-containing protein [Clathrospora elynae]|uniref:Zf-MYND-domain-containing protein n=1 Tax=Clathrospora elynae TaxID=706981 RepID=A0A6A5SLA1_9PLEO|nr:zf-MYND-domain-containing protein [Clathrospora elynae]